MKENPIELKFSVEAMPGSICNIPLGESGIQNSLPQVKLTDESAGSNEMNIPVNSLGLGLTLNRESWLEEVRQGLEAYTGNGTLDQQDAIFASHTLHIREQLENGDMRSACNAWDEKLETLVSSREKQLGQLIHKGAPYYNTGLAYFVAGNFDAAFCFLAEAGGEDARNGRGDRNLILRGQHPLSRQMLIEPISKLFFCHWQDDYLRITSKLLDEGEFIDLLEGISGRVSDSLQLVCALHKFRISLATPQNHAAALIRVKAIGEMLHLVESYLRQFQSIEGQLKVRLDAILLTNQRMKMGYDEMAVLLEREAIAKSWSQKSPNSLNWIYKETHDQLSKGGSAARLAGLCAFFCHKYRNTLLHVNEEGLTVFQRQEDCIQVIGWVLSMLRLCRHAKDQTLAALS